MLAVVGLLNFVSLKATFRPHCLVSEEVFHQFLFIVKLCRWFLAVLWCVLFLLGSR